MSDLKIGKMSPERQGEIALKLVKRYLMEREMSAPNDFRREIGSVAKEVDESTDTMVAFYEAILPELLGKMLGHKNVFLTTSD